jgi:uncharacterized protein (TIGR03086 family)
MAITDLGPAADRLCTLIESVPDSDLGRPTPCTDYSVGDLLDHIAGITLAFGGAASKSEGPSSTMGPQGDGSNLDDDWRASLPARVRGLAQAWRDPQAWTGITHVAGGDQPGEIIGIVALGELVVHGWDLAQGTGTPFEVDPTTLVALYDLTRHTFGPDQDPAARGEAFGPAVAVDPIASELDQTLALLGRDPAWSAPFRVGRRSDSARSSR